MTRILILGFLLGMRHALEADHLAAVATLNSRARSVRQAAMQGAVWGLGHTLTLFLACSLVLFVDAMIPERLSRLLEGAVGIMLLLLGLDLLVRLWRGRLHIHTHRHDDGTAHSHAHSHTGEPAIHAHPHAHDRRFPARALCVGAMHGLAGSAALILLTLGTVASPVTGLLYVALFGLGSVAGMALLSLLISVPLHRARRFARLHAGMQAALGLASLGIGVDLVYQHFYLA